MRDAARYAAFMEITTVLYRMTCRRVMERRSSLPPAEADFGPLHGAYGPSWRIRQSESLFDYPPGMTTASYDRAGIPDRLARPADFAGGVKVAAELICHGLGVNEDPFLSNCIFDVGLGARVSPASPSQRPVPLAHVP